MKIKDAFVLAAGMGSRMGPLGENIPKPLFPIFEKSILEIIILQLKELGINNIYVNSHHQYELLNSYVKSKKIEINLLHEPKLLGSGGAFYNLKKNYPKLKNILALNADTILNLSNNHIQFLCSELVENNQSACLLGLNVSESNEFNRLNIKKNCLQGIILNKSDTDLKPFPLTYSGVSIVNLDKLDPLYFGKETSFFESVADYLRSKVGVFAPDRIEVHDFGTIDNYILSMTSLFEKDSDFIFKFVKKTSSKNLLSCENELCLVEIAGKKLKYSLRL